MAASLPGSLLPPLGLSPVVPRKGPLAARPGTGSGAGLETIPLTPPESNVPGLPLLVAPFPYFPPGPTPLVTEIGNYPMNLTCNPRTNLQASGGSSTNPLFKSDLSHPHIYSPMVTFNEPSENVRGMFSFVLSCEFSPGANNKLLSSLVKR